MNGLGFAALIVLLLVGIPWAMWFDAKKKPGVGAPGRTNQKGTEIV